LQQIGSPGQGGLAQRAHDPGNAESVLAMLERCIDTPHTPETRQSILTTLFGPASQFLCDGRIQAQDLLSWIS